MELEVLSTAGIPKNGIISIRAGSTRRQVQASDLERPLKFPSRPEDVQFLKVEVLDVLGTGRLPFVPLQDKYTMPIDPVREGAAGLLQGQDGGGAPQDGDGSPMEVSFTIRPTDADVMGETVESFHNDPAKDPSVPAWRRRKEVEAHGYLEEHGLAAFMQMMLQSLMKDKPTDPYSFLHKQLGHKLAVLKGGTPTTAGGFAPMSRSETHGTAGPVEGTVCQLKHSDTNVKVLERVGTNVRVEMPTGEATWVPLGELEVEAEDPKVNELIDKLKIDVDSKVSEEELSELGRQAEKASEKLRNDNEKLRRSALVLKMEYEKLMKERGDLQTMLEKKLSVAGAAAEQPEASSGSAEAKVEAIRQVAMKTLLVAAEDGRLQAALGEGQEASPADEAAAKSAAPAARQDAELEATKRKAQNALAAALVPQEEEKAERVFDEVDTDQDGVLSHEEFRKATSQSVMHNLERPSSRGCGSPTAQAYREISQMQDDVNQLAKENAELVAELADIRRMIDEVREDIDMMHKALMRVNS